MVGIGTGTRKIVVGVDGSESSLDALKWAAQQARMTGSSLEVVATWEYPTSFGWAPAWPADWDPQSEATVALSHVVDKVLGTQRDIEVEQIVRNGKPEPILLEAAQDAELLVVGSRGHGAFAGMLLGSVSEHCAKQATCPVVIVRHRHTDEDRGGLDDER